MYVMRNLMEMITASKNFREAIKSSLTQKWACSKITEVQWISLTKYLRDLDLYIAWPTNRNYLTLSIVVSHCFFANKGLIKIEFGESFDC